MHPLKYLGMAVLTYVLMIAIFADSFFKAVLFTIGLSLFMRTADKVKEVLPKGGMNA